MSRRVLDIQGRVFQRGDLVLFVSYVPDGEGYSADGMDSKQPMMVVGRKKHGTVTSRDNRGWGIPLSEAWRYATPDGYPTTYLLAKTADIGNQLGLGDSVHVRRQIWTFILDYLPDLLAQAEYGMTRSVLLKPNAEVKLFAAGKFIGGQEFRA